MEVPVEVVLDVHDLGPGGGRRPDLQYILKIVCAGDTFVPLGDMGDDPLYQSNPLGIPPQDGLPVYGDATTAQYRGELVIPNDGSGNVVVGYGGGGAVRPPPPEHHRRTYHDLSDIGTVSGGGAASGSAGSTDMVRT